MRKINENELRVVDAGRFHWGEVEEGYYSYGFMNKEKKDYLIYSICEDGYGFAVIIRGFELLVWERDGSKFLLTLFDRTVIGRYIG